MYRCGVLDEVEGTPLYDTVRQALGIGLGCPNGLAPALVELGREMSRLDGMKKPPPRETEADLRARRTSELVKARIEKLLRM